MSSLILPPSAYRRNKELEADFAKTARGYAKHKVCTDRAFYFKRFGKAWFDYDSSEIFFKDGQVKLKNRPIEDYRCGDCGVRLTGEELMLIKIIQDDEAEAMHMTEHMKTPVGVICETCGKRKEG